MAESRRRFRISKENRQVLELLKSTKYLGAVNSMDVKNKDIFLYTLAIGKDIPTKLKNPDQWFEDSDMDSEERAIVYSVVYAATGSIDSLTEFERVRGIVDEMSNAGLEVLKDKIESGSLENVEKKMIRELDKLFEGLER